MLKSDVELPAETVAIIGRNGAGKSRLLEAIAERKIVVRNGATEIPASEILHFPTEKIQPDYGFGFDADRRKKRMARAKERYLQYRGKFLATPDETILQLQGRHPEMPPPSEQANFVSIPELVHAVFCASQSTGRNVNDLDPEVVANTIVMVPASPIGGLKVT